MLKLFTQHRYLLWQFTKRQIDQRHKGSFLGALWCVVQPLTMMAIYTVVFGLIFKGSYAGVEGQSTLDYALGIFLSLTIFQMIAEIVNISPSVILSQPNLVKKVVFPLEILPVSGCIVAIYQFSISLVLTLIGVVAFGRGLHIGSFSFLIALLPLFPTCLGIALLFSSLGVFIRDLQHLAGPLTMVLMYASAVFYSTSMVPPAIWMFIKYNPLLHIIEPTRATLLWGEKLDVNSFIYASASGVVILVLGSFVFRKSKAAFADVI